MRMNGFSSIEGGGAMAGSLTNDTSSVRCRYAVRSLADDPLPTPISFSFSFSSSIFVVLTLWHLPPTLLSQDTVVGSPRLDPPQAIVARSEETRTWNATAAWNVHYTIQCPQSSSRYLR